MRYSLKTVKEISYEKYRCSDVGQALIGAEKRGGIKGGKIACVNAFAPERAKKITYTYRFD